MNGKQYTGQDCDCGGQIWLIEEENSYRCNVCNARYKLPDTTVQEQLSQLKGPNDNEEGLITKIWNKTIFPDLIKARKERKRVERKRKAEEKAVIAEVTHEARKEALKELKPQLKEKIKEQEIKKLTGEAKKEKLEKFANAFSFGGTGDPNKPNKYVDMLGMGNTGIGSTDKIQSMLGSGQQSDIGTDEQMRKLIGGTKPQTRQLRKKPKQKTESYEEKIRRMLQ